MCRAIRCSTCNKTTWAGCGQHVDAVKASVPAADWCNGKHSAAETASAPKTSFMDRFLRR